MCSQKPRSSRWFNAWQNAEPDETGHKSDLFWCFKLSTIYVSNIRYVGALDIIIVNYLSDKSGDYLFHVFGKWDGSVGDLGWRLRPGVVQSYQCGVFVGVGDLLKRVADYRRGVHPYSDFK